jgi:hypothetical protein
MASALRVLVTVLAEVLVDGQGDDLALPTPELRGCDP